MQHSLETSLISKRVKLIKQELLFNADPWGRQFPARLSTQSCEYLSAKDLTDASLVCNGWKLPLDLENRLWQRLYAVDFELETSSDTAIANDGVQTAWKTRYGRRFRVQRNLKANKFEHKQVTLPHVFCV